MLRAALSVWASTPVAVENFNLRTKFMLLLLLRQKGDIAEAEELQIEVEKFLEASGAFDVKTEDPMARWDQIVPYWGR